MPTEERQALLERLLRVVAAMLAWQERIAPGTALAPEDPPLSPPALSPASLVAMADELLAALGHSHCP